MTARLVALGLLGALAAWAQLEPALVATVSRDLAVEPDASEISVRLPSGGDLEINQALVALAPLQARAEHLTGAGMDSSPDSGIGREIRVTSRSWMQWRIPSNRRVDADRQVLEALQTRVRTDYAIQRVTSPAAIEAARRAVYRELMREARAEAEALAARGGFRVGPIVGITETMVGGARVRLRVEFARGEAAGAAIAQRRRVAVVMDRPALSALSRVRHRLTVRAQPSISRDVLLTFAARLGFTESHWDSVSMGLFPSIPASRTFEFARSDPAVAIAVPHRAARDVPGLGGDVQSLELSSTLVASPAVTEEVRAADAQLIAEARINAEALAEAAGLPRGTIRTLEQLEGERFVEFHVLFLGLPASGLFADELARKLAVTFELE